MFPILRVNRRLFKCNVLRTEPASFFRGAGKGDLRTQCPAEKVFGVSKTEQTANLFFRKVISSVLLVKNVIWAVFMGSQRSPRSTESHESIL